MLASFATSLGASRNASPHPLRDDPNAGCVGDWGRAWRTHWGNYAGIFFERFVPSAASVNNTVLNR